MHNKKREYEAEMEREIKQVASCLVRKVPTTTSEGMRQYKRIERQTVKLVKNGHAVSEWEKIRQIFIDFWNEEF